jgi:hypothetical protein
MPIIYNVTIEPTGKENRFQVTLHNPGNNPQDCLTQEKIWCQAKS